MASDISITITADPNQAVKGIEKVGSASKDLGRSVEQANRAAASAADSASRSIQQTVSATGKLGGELKQVGRAASGITSALGDSVPIVGKLGGAISSIVAGPLGIVSAAIAAAGMAIQKMIADAEDRIQRLRLSSSTQASSAYDRLMQGRAQYAQDLKTLEQVRAVNSAAQKSKLSSAQLAEFRRLASQIGIEERYVGARGIRSGQLSQAARTLQQQRSFYADQEYQDYLDSMTVALRSAVSESKLNAAQKRSLSQMGVLDLADAIASRAKSGAGWTTDEYKAYQDLYAVAKPLLEVRASYNRDAMLGRTQAELNAAAVASITGGKPAAGSAGAAGGSAASPGSWAYQKELDKQAAAASKKRADAIADTLKGLRDDISVQSLISEGKQREAYLLQQRIRLEERLGEKLSEAQAAELNALSGTLFDLRNPVAAAMEEAAAELSGAQAPGSSPRRAAAGNAWHLDRLQRIGANVTVPVATPEKVTLDKQLSVQEQMNAKMDALIQNSYKMRF